MPAPQKALWACRMLRLPRVQLRPMQMPMATSPSLLDLLDRHEGVVILCTNRPDVLDKALGRRIGWTVEFPAPDVAGRLAIWRSLVPLAATGGQELDLRGLAHRHRLSGGRIRNAVIRAASRAASSGSDLNLAALEAAAQEENANGEQSTTQMYGVGDA